MSVPISDSGGLRSRDLLPIPNSSKRRISISPNGCGMRFFPNHSWRCLPDGTFFHEYRNPKDPDLEFPVSRRISDITKLFISRSRDVK